MRLNPRRAGELARVLGVATLAIGAQVGLQGRAHAVAPNCSMVVGFTSLPVYPYATRPYTGVPYDSSAATTFTVRTGFGRTLMDYLTLGGSGGTVSAAPDQGWLACTSRGSTAAADFGATIVSSTRADMVRYDRLLVQIRLHIAAGVETVIVTDSTKPARFAFTFTAQTIMVGGTHVISGNISP